MDNVVSQQIPHDSDAEKAVLGAVFLNPEAIIEASDIVQPDDFYERANRLVFQAMLNIADRGDEIDPVTLQDELKKNNQLEDIGGIASVSELTLDTPTFLREYSTSHRFRRWGTSLLVLQQQFM